MPRLARLAGPAALLAAAFCALLWALAFGGGTGAPALLAQGDAVRYGLPIARLLVNLSAAGMIGALVLCCFALSRVGPAFPAGLGMAAACAAALALAAVATGFLSFLSVSTLPGSTEATFGTALGAFVTGSSIGQAWLTTAILAAVVTVLSLAVRGSGGLAIVTVLAIGSLLPMAGLGHASEPASHAEAVTALALHLIFACVWLGGLLAVVLLARRVQGPALLAVLERYSSIAMVSFVVVAASGYGSAALSIGTLPDLTSAYGLLVLVKAAALLVLGTIGWLHRRRLIRRLRLGVGHRPFWWLIASELAVLGIASGVAVALSRTAPPVPGLISGAPTAAELLTGDPLPAPPTAVNVVSGIHLDLVWVLVCGFGAFFYLAAVIRLRRRGERWPLHRTVLWLLGLLLLLYLTCGGVGVYGRYLFSAHFAVVLAVTAAVPVLLVPAAPSALALAALRRRSDGSSGGREWLLFAVNSRVTAALSQPVIAFALFAASVWAYTYTPMLRWSVTNQLGHEFMVAQLLVTGCLYLETVIGSAPLRRRLPIPLRLLPPAAALVFFAVLGAVIALSDGLLLADWFGAMGRPWGPPAIADQQWAGVLTWLIGGIPALVIAAVVCARWARAGSTIRD